MARHPQKSSMHASACAGFSGCNRPIWQLMIFRMAARPTADSSRRGILQDPVVPLRRDKKLGTLRSGYTVSSAICTPNSLSQDVGLGLGGAQKVREMPRAARARERSESRESENDPGGC
jgi:hypothetical protein